MRITSTGNVGIGQTTPASRLVVKGSSSGSTTSALNITNSGDTSLLFVRDDGNVGIGTASPNAKLNVFGSIGSSSFSPQEDLLHIGGNELGGVNGYAGIRLAGISGGLYGVYIRGVKTAAYGNYWNNALTFSVTRTNTETTIDEVMRITSGGDVGIGATNPSSRLEIREANRGNGTNITNFGIYTTSTQNIDVGGTIGLGGLYDGSNFAPFGSIRGGKENSTSGNYAGYLAFQTIPNNSVLFERMRITSGGNVGIGTTSPNFKTHISTGDASSITQPTAGSYGLYIQQNTSGSVGGLYIQDGASNTGNSIYVGDNNNVARFIVNTDGNVGIGTSNPNNILAIERSSNSGSAIGYPLQTIKNTLAAQGDGSSTYNFAGLNISSGNGAVDMYLSTSYALNTWEPAGIITVVTNHPLIVKTNNTEQMRITSGGNIRMNSVVYNNAPTGTLRTLYIGNGDYTIGGGSSIRSSKTNIENITDVSWLNNLNPVKFNYRKKNEEGQYIDEYYDELSYGLIAEDVEPINDLLCNYDVDEDGNKKLIGIEYPRLIVPMLKLIQEQNQIINNLESRLQALENV
ncbi:MAG: tail fiber domain-containing protein [Caulobacteraceae bacterium]|nr:tail fiber domain-containing protein [Caulobacteraceae bacterium]